MENTLQNAHKKALKYFSSYAAERKDLSYASIKHILRMSNVDFERFNSFSRKMLEFGRVVLHFHPDRYVNNTQNVVQSMLQSGLYKNQYETLISNGGLSAYAGGDRDNWEKKLFNGAYHQGEFNAKLRPKYGAFNILKSEYGAAPRFGSCYFILKPHVNDHCTFTYSDSSDLPSFRGTKKDFYVILSKLLKDLYMRNYALGYMNLSLVDLINFIEEKNWINPEIFNMRFKVWRNSLLNDYIEAQVHNDIILEQDVEYVVVDPSFQGSKMMKEIEKLSKNFGIKIKFHSGFKLHLKQITSEFRGPSMPKLATKMYLKNNYLTALDIGKAAQLLKQNNRIFDEFGDEKSVTQELKLLWHVLFAFGDQL